MQENKDKKDDFIFGLRPVIEAIEAGKTVDKVFVKKMDYRDLSLLN